MTATLVRANCKLIFLCNSDSVPPVALLTKNTPTHYLFIIPFLGLSIQLPTPLIEL